MNIILGFNGGQQFSKVLKVFLFIYIPKWLFLSKKFIHLFWKVLYKYGFIIIILPILTRTRNKVFLNTGSYIFTFVHFGELGYFLLYSFGLKVIPCVSPCIFSFLRFTLWSFTLNSPTRFWHRHSLLLLTMLLFGDVAVALIENVSRCNCRPILLVISNLRKKAIYQISWIWRDLVNLVNNLGLN